VLLGLADQRRLQRLHPLVQPVEGIAHPQRKSVATWSLRLRAVCSGRRRADDFGQPRLHIHVDVFSEV